MRDVARITQRFRINDLHRKWKAGVPARVRKGLPPLGPPYGYTITGKETPPRLDPLKAAIILRIKDEFLAGRSMNQICAGLDTDGIPTPRLHPRWHHTTAINILINPFYAGIVFLGRTVKVYDSRLKKKKRRVRQPDSRWETAPGLHEALWDEPTRQAILAEHSRRAGLVQRFQVKRPLAGLLVCSVCHERLRRRTDGSKNNRIYVLVCRSGIGHLRLTYDTGVDLVAQELTSALASRTYEPFLPSEHDPNPKNKKILAELGLRRKRIQDGFERGLYTHLEAAERLSALTRQEEMLQEQMRHSEQVSLSWAEWQENLTANPQMLEHFPEWIRFDDPVLVNKLLSSIIEKILVYPDYHVEIVWRK